MAARGLLVLHEWAVLIGHEGAAEWSIKTEATSYSQSSDPAILPFSWLAETASSWRGLIWTGAHDLRIDGSRYAPGPYTPVDPKAESHRILFKSTGAYLSGSSFR